MLRKTIDRFLALILIPCLISDPVLADLCYPSSWNSQPCQQTLFHEQAFVEPLLSSGLIERVLHSGHRINLTWGRFLADERGEIGNDHPIAQPEPTPRLFPVKSVQIQYAGFRVHLPPYLVSQLDYHWWRQEGDYRVYGEPGQGRTPARTRREFPEMEFVVRERPQVRLHLKLEDSKTMTVTFLNGDALPQHETVPALPMELDALAVVRAFIDAAYGIPASPSPARAEAIRDWLLRLDSNGQAVSRDNRFNVGLGAGPIRMPWDMIARRVPETGGENPQSRAMVQVLSEGGRNARFLLLRDRLNPNLFLVLETDSQRRIINARTGSLIHPRDKTYHPADLQEGRLFFQEASRALLVTHKEAGVGSSYPLYRDLSRKIYQELGLPRNQPYTIIKVEESSFPTLTGTKGPWTDNTEGRVAYPTLVADRAIELPETLTENDRRKVLEASQFYLAFPESSQLSPYLGYSQKGVYAYWKRLQGSMYMNGRSVVVYRRLTSDDPHILVHAQMISGDRFSIEGVNWATGPQKGSPVLFDGRINLSMLAAKYGDNRILTMKPQLRESFMPDHDSLSETRARQRPPELRMDSSGVRIVPGETQHITRIDTLEKAATVELGTLNKFEGHFSAAAPDIANGVNTILERLGARLDNDPVETIKTRYLKIGRNESTISGLVHEIRELTGESADRFLRFWAICYATEFSAVTQADARVLYAFEDELIDYLLSLLKLNRASFALLSIPIHDMYTNASVISRFFEGKIETTSFKDSKENLIAWIACFKNNTTWLAPPETLL